MSNDKHPHCYVCLKPVVGRYYLTDWGFVCARCYQPQKACFTCGRQTLLRLADSRACCADCAATAVYIVDNTLVAEIKRRLSWFPACPTSFAVVDLRLLHVTGRPTNGTVLGRCETTTLSTLGFTRVVCHQVSILFGLPNELCQAGLVHELFHAWLHENVARSRFSAGQTEWLCEQAAWNYLRSFNAQRYWLDKVAASRDRFPSVSGLKMANQEAIMRVLRH